MADDVNLATPAGIAAADDVGGKLYQKVKSGWGADGIWNETDTATGKPFPVQAMGTSATDRSGTIAVGSTAQNVMAANTARRTWTFFNNGDTDMYLHVAGTAVVGGPGILIAPNACATGADQNAISVICATTGKAFTAWER